MTCSVETFGDALVSALFRTALNLNARAEYSPTVNSRKSVKVGEPDGSSSVVAINSVALVSPNDDVSPSKNLPAHQTGQPHHQIRLHNPPD